MKHQLIKTEWQDEVQYACSACPYIVAIPKDLQGKELRKQGKVIQVGDMSVHGSGEEGDAVMA